MRIPQSIVEQIFHTADIVEVISDYVTLKKKGANYVGLSPFKVEKTPSFTVSPAKKIYKCFSTGKGGGVVDFLMEIEGYTYKEALLALAQRYKITIDISPDIQQVDNRKESYYSLNKFASNFFKNELKYKPEVLEYLTARGFSKETVEAFHIGYAPDGWHIFTDLALKNLYRQDALLAVGLSFLSEKNNQLIDRFRDRIMFPILDVNGKVAGFGGRIFKPGATGAKYVNSPESEIYHKSRILYGLFQAKIAIRERDECILVEGYTDVISLHQAGVKNVVASSGTSLTEEQIKLLARYTRNVLIIYDGDVAGVKASLRGIDLLLAQGLRVRVLQLPPDQDPDSFVREKGGAAFQTFAAQNAHDFIQFKISALSANFTTLDPTQRALLVEDIATSLAKINDSILLTTYVQYASETLRMPEPPIWAAIQKARLIQQPTFSTRTSETEYGRIDGQEPHTEQTPDLYLQANPNPHLKAQGQFYFQEKEILRLLLNHYDNTIETEDYGKINVLAYLVMELEGMSFEHHAFEQIRNFIFEAYAQTGTFDHFQLIEHFNQDKSIASIIADLLILPYHLSENWAKRDIIVPNLDANLLYSVIDTLHKYQIKRVRVMIDENLAQLENYQKINDDEGVLKCLKRQQKLTFLSQNLTKQNGIVFLPDLV